MSNITLLEAKVLFEDHGFNILYNGVDREEAYFIANKNDGEEVICELYDGKVLVTVNYEAVNINDIL